MTVSRIVISAFVGLCSVAAFAQVSPSPTAPTNTTDQSQPVAGQSAGPSKGARDNSQSSAIHKDGAGQNDTTNDPNANPNGAQGADANSAAKPTGPELIDDTNATPEQKASAEYSGPAVLSRGITASEPMNPKNIKFTPTIGLDYLLNSGLTGVAIQPNGTLPNKLSSGLQLSYGLRGEKVFKKDVFSLSLIGNVYHYAQASSYDGTDENLSLTWHHQLLRHLKFGLSVMGQEYDRNNLLTSGSELIDSGAGTTLVTASPSTEAFDGRVITLQTIGDLTYQATSRLSINMSGGGFETRRASSSLYGDTGYQAGADVAYRFTRQITAGVYYGYTNFDFTGVYGSTDIHTVGATYSIAFSPTTQLITRVGGSRLETTGLTSLAVNPLIAALLGTPTVLEAIYKVNYTPDINVQLRHKISNLALSLAYVRGVTPGNGVILTSVRQSGSFGMNYATRRYWSFSVNTGYDSLTSFGATSTKYASVFAGGNLTRKIAKDFSWHTRIDFHHYTFDSTGFLRNSFVLGTGIIWTPGSLLDRVW